jgi:hypothetical protein
MVRRIKAIAAAASTAFLDSLRSGLAVSPVKQEEETDQPIGLLVRNAFREEAAEIDMSHVWAELSGRVKGPFGMLAVEGPAFSYSDGAALIASHGHLDAQSSSMDYNHPLPAADQVHTTLPYKGADIHMANLR